MPTTEQNINQLMYLKQEWKRKQVIADAIRSVYGYDEGNEYAWSTNMLRSISLKIYHLKNNNK